MNAPAAGTGADFAFGVDVGGTHTDLILSGPEGLVRSKAFATHGNYSEGIFNALEDVAEARARAELPIYQSFV
jgi:N-methylhydantoinase A/oxoprolinase/acetone carboxylase beta subunit